jgi:hypothetical protein
MIYNAITTTEMKFIRTTKYTWMDYKRNEDIGLLKELIIETILDTILKYKTIWIQHVARIQNDRLHKLLEIVNNID